MIKRIVLLILFLIVTVNFAFAQRDKSSFDTKPFDVNVTKLPVNYDGHDVYKIFNELWKRKNLKKSEYETTIDFNKRLTRENKKPMYAKVLSTDTLALVADNKNFITSKSGRGSSPSVKQEYDADKKILSISTNIDNDGQITALLCLLESTTARYMEFYSYLTDILSNHAFNNGMITSGNITITLQHILPKTAKSYKNKLGILFVYKIIDPHNIDAFGNRMPGPKEITTNSYKLPVNVSQIWLYNRSTGDILSKYK